MKIPVWLATVICTAGFAALGWLCLTVVDLRTDFAVVKNDVGSIKQSLSVLENRGGNVATR